MLPLRDIERKRYRLKYNTKRSIDYDGKVVKIDGWVKIRILQTQTIHGKRKTTVTFRYYLIGSEELINFIQKFIVLIFYKGETIFYGLLIFNV